MATLGTYYFDGTSFVNASMLFTDAQLTTVAPNGYYMQNDVVRQLVGGPSNPVLLQAQTCATCSVPCGGGINGNGATGKYTLSMNLGNSIGAVVITFNPQSVPDKCTWTYDGVSKSEYSSPNDGYLRGMIGTVNSASTCTLAMDNATGSNNQTITGASYVYDAGSNTFVNQGIPVTLGPYLNQASGGVDFTTNAPGDCIMVVPKPNITPEVLDIVIEGPCAGTAWSIAVACPTTLTSFNRTSVQQDLAAACAATANLQGYNVPVNALSSAGVPQLHDWVFEDENAVTELSLGFYKIVTQPGTPAEQTYVITVQDGVVTQIQTCLPPP